MRRLGFEPRKALSYDGLNVTHLTTLASPHKIVKISEVLNYAFKRVLGDLYCYFIIWIEEIFPD